MTSALPRLTLRLAAGLAALLFAGSALAQAYPTKPIRILLPFAGGTDAVARLLSFKASPALGQQLVVEQRLGAGGNIAHEAVAKAAPDGYTLLMAAPPLVINPFLHKVNYDPVKDFVPVALLTAIPNVLVVHPSVKANTLAELLALARANPGKYTYGSGGVGSSNHLAAEMMKATARVDIVHVPYKSATLALTAALGGETDIVIVAASSAASYVKDGRMRAIAVLDTKRSSAMPDVPTAAEAGMPALVAVNWYILLAPAGTPQAIVDRLNAESVKAMAAPDMRERLVGLGGEPSALTPAETAAFLRQESAQWGKVIRERGIKGE
ncbi:MAG: tripartite tricarboxylate transporter substrate binding protein [Betaproteobacteria bacterium]